MENGVGEGEEESEEPRENGLDAHPPEQSTQPKKPVKRIHVTYEEYKTIANLLVFHLRQVEESSKEGGCLCLWSLFRKVHQFHYAGLYSVADKS